MVKRAFTLIELIISIVIIGIASMTLPLMLSSANKLEEQTLSQDIFFKSVTVMTDILSKSWDNTQAADINDNEKGWQLIWHTQNTDTNMRDATNLDSTDKYRVATLQNYNYRYFFKNKDDGTKIYASDIDLTSGEIKSDSTGYTYINKYNNKYIDDESGNVRYDIGVRYVSDTVVTDLDNSKRQKATWTLGESGGEMAADKSTNLKRIYIKASRNIGSDNMEVGFTYFSSNIGTPGIKTK